MGVSGVQAFTKERAAQAGAVLTADAGSTIAQDANAQLIVDIPALAHMAPDEETLIVVARSIISRTRQLLGTVDPANVDNVAIICATDPYENNEAKAWTEALRSKSHALKSSPMHVPDSALNMHIPERDGFFHTDNTKKAFYYWLEDYLMTADTAISQFWKTFRMGPMHSPRLIREISRGPELKLNCDSRLHRRSVSLRDLLFYESLLGNECLENRRLPQKLRFVVAVSPNPSNPEDPNLHVIACVDGMLRDMHLPLSLALLPFDRNIVLAQLSEQMAVGINITGLELPSTIDVPECGTVEVLGASVRFQTRIFEFRDYPQHFAKATEADFIAPSLAVRAGALGMFTTHICACQDADWIFMLLLAQMAMIMRGMPDRIVMKIIAWGGGSSMDIDFRKICTDRPDIYHQIIAQANRILFLGNDFCLGLPRVGLKGGAPLLEPNSPTFVSLDPRAPWRLVIDRKRARRLIEQTSWKGNFHAPAIPTNLTDEELWEKGWMHMFVLLREILDDLAPDATRALWFA